MSHSTRIVSRRDISGFTVRWDEELAALARATGEWPGVTVAQLARQRFQEHPGRVQVIDEETSYTCAQVYQAALNIAAYFCELGLKPGDVVSFQLPNWWEANALNIACAMRGLVVNPIVPINRERELTYILNDSNSKVLFIPQVYRRFDYVDMLARIGGSLKSPPQLVVVRAGADGHTSFESIQQGYRGDDSLLCAVDADAVKLLMYTSGTTGLPKGVLHTHNTVHADGMKMVPAMGLTPADTTFSPSPITHVSGYLWALNVPWLADIPVVTMDIWEPGKALALLKRNQCSFMLGATPFLRGLVDVARREGEPLAHLRHYLCGGAAVPPQLIYEAAETFPNCIPWRNFGATEAMTMTRGPSSRLGIKLGAETDGRLYQCEVRIVDPLSGVPLAPGEEGEVLVKEASMAVGYVRAEDNAAAYDADGFFMMGDLGRIVYRDHIQITGRKKDLIIRHGENISAKEIEDALFASDNVEDVAVVGVPDPNTGERICAFLVTRDHREISLQDVAACIARAGLAKQKTPVQVHVLDELPKTASGKVRKHELRDLAARLARDEA